MMKSNVIYVRRGIIISKVKNVMIGVILKKAIKCQKDSAINVKLKSVFSVIGQFGLAKNVILEKKIRKNTYIKILVLKNAQRGISMWILNAVNVKLIAIVAEIFITVINAKKKIKFR